MISLEHAWLSSSVDAGLEQLSLWRRAKANIPIQSSLHWRVKPTSDAKNPTWPSGIASNLEFIKPETIFFGQTSFSRGVHCTLWVQSPVRALNSGVSKPPLYGGGEGFVFSHKIPDMKSHALRKRVTDVACHFCFLFNHTRI